MKRLLFFLPVVALAAEPSLLDRPVENLRFEQAPLPAALRALARACDTSVRLDADVGGEITMELNRGSLRVALAAMLEPGGFSFAEIEGGIAVRFRTTAIYRIDYPQLTRSGSGSASITLSGASNPANAGSAAVSPVGLNGTNTDGTQISISQDNQNTFWNGLEAELKSMLREGDSLVVNRFSGVAQVTAPAPRQTIVRTYLETVNRRITRQVEIEARIVEVTLRDEQKLGVDWDLAAISLGGGVVAQASAPLQVTGVGGSTFGSNTFTANLGWRESSAVIHALKQQGEVRTVAQPTLRALNNQTSFIRVGQDRPFFRLQQTTTFQQGGTTTPVNQTQEQYSVSTIAIGTILAVTPQIDDEGVVTLDVLPAITRLQAVVTSPDGRQTAPVTEKKEASTIVRLRDGETAVIGGLISEENGESTRAIPVLGATPLVGRAFRSKGTQRGRTELVIFLTPRVVR